MSQEWEPTDEELTDLINLAQRMPENSPDDAVEDVEFYLRQGDESQ